MNSEMTGKGTAIVTGASRGIGLEISRALLKAGYSLIMNAKDEAGLGTAAGDLAEAVPGARIRTVPGDIADPATAARLLAAAEKLRLEAGSPRTIDLLVNNAGISHVGLMQDMSDAEWQQLMGTNVSGVFYTCRAAVPYMIRQNRGCILNISSVWGRVGASCEAAYSASKGAVDAFTRALARELAPGGIRVNAIACGVIDTSMNGHLSPEEKEALREEIPAGRFGRPEEVAELCVRLADAGGYLTGQVITLDGGWT